MFKLIKIPSSYTEPFVMGVTGARRTKKKMRRRPLLQSANARIQGFELDDSDSHFCFFWSVQMPSYPWHSGTMVRLFHGCRVSRSVQHSNKYFENIVWSQTVQYCICTTASTAKLPCLDFTLLSRLGEFRRVQLKLSGTSEDFFRPIWTWLSEKNYCTQKRWTHFFSSKFFFFPRLFHIVMSISTPVCAVRKEMSATLSTKSN